MRPAFRPLVPALQALGASSVPVVGTLAAGWSAATSLALYWCENLLGALLVAVLIARHRRLTRKRGHWRSQLGTRTRTIRKVRGKRVVCLIGTGWRDGCVGLPIQRCDHSDNR